MITVEQFCAACPGDVTITHSSVGHHPWRLQVLDVHEHGDVDVYGDHLPALLEQAAGKLLETIRQEVLRSEERARVLRALLAD